MVDIDIDEYFNNLIQRAMTDGIITAEERIMINSITNQLETYSKILDEAMEDGIITLKEKLELYKFRTEMFRENLSIVKEDDHVSQDEVNLLNTLTSMLTEMGIHEDEYKSEEL